MRRALVVAIVIGFGVVLSGCGDDDTGDAIPDGADTTPPADDGGEPSEEGGSVDDALGSGTVTVDGVAYSFEVFSCAEVSGQPHLGGEGDANVALSGNTFIVQIDGGMSYTVTSPEVSLDGETVTASGQGNDLATSTSKMIELSATCSRF